MVFQPDFVQRHLDKLRLSPWHGSLAAGSSLIVDGFRCPLDWPTSVRGAVDWVHSIPVISQMSQKRQVVTSESILTEEKDAAGHNTGLE